MIGPSGFYHFEQPDVKYRRNGPHFANSRGYESYHLGEIILYIDQTGEVGKLPYRERRENPASNWWVKL